MRRKLTTEEFEILRNEVGRLGFTSILNHMRPDNTEINGATFYEASDTPEGKVFSYVEDDLADEKGNTYYFENPYRDYLGILNNGRRLIALYLNGGFTVLLPADGESCELVGGAIYGDGEFVLDKGKAVKLPSPYILNLPKGEAVEMTDEDRAKLKPIIEKIDKQSKSSKIVGSIAIGFGILVVFGFLFVMIGASVESDAALIALLIIIPAIMIATMIWAIRTFLTVHIKRALKLKYIKKVMLGYNGAGRQMGTQGIGFYEWVNGEIIYKYYDVGSAQIFLDKGDSYGSIVYKLGKDKESKPVFFDGVIISSKL